MYAHNIRAADDSHCHRRGGAFETLIGGQVEGVADERFTRRAEQNRESQGADLAEAVDQFEVVFDLFPETDTGVEDDVRIRDAGLTRQT